ncbi:MAG: hypothetical protein M3478_03130 [Planctomycetota bacterium]|nr:hypothetical protein [Planctomycetota bacterium]
MGFENELRLLYAIALNVLALAAAYRFARRRHGGDLVRRLIDAGLIYYLLQYVVIGMLGMLGLLSPWTIGPLALMACALLWVGSGWRRDEKLVPVPPPPQAKPLLDRAAVLACFAFVAAYASAFVYQQRHLPPTADDALTYHLPAALQWLQTGRIDLFPTWFFNPANAYSPLGGSMFMAWLIAPTGNDVLVRYVQLGPLLLLFLVVLELGRLLGARDATAALVATACVMTRSFVNQIIVPKDDLFLTVFCVAAVMSLASTRADEKWAPLRAGVSIGLLLAMKYTAMFSLPILLLMADVPSRHARWRRGGWVVALAIAALLAGPWYVRNAMLTGNPLFPIDITIGGASLLNGLFSMTRSAAMRRPAEILNVLMGGHGFYGPPPRAMVLLLLAWFAALVMNFRAALREPLWRASLIGSVASIAMFVVLAPYAEVRFIYPAIGLLFAVAAGVAGRIRHPGDLIAAGTLLVVVFSTTLADSTAKQGFAIVGLIVAALVAAMYAFMPPRFARRVRVATALSFFVLCGGYAYVNWAAYLNEYAAGRSDAWTAVHGDIAKGWAAVDREVPAGSVVAYANAHFVYPLQGATLRNRIVYAPSRPGLGAMHDLPPSPIPLAGEQIRTLFAEQTQHAADARTWRDNLVATGADYLFVAKDGEIQPPELSFIAERSAAFELLHDDPAAALYRIRDPSLLAD